MLGNLVKEQCSMFVVSSAPTEDVLGVFNAAYSRVR